MLDKQDAKQIEIAVRMYENQTYGTTYGKGLYRKAIYNASIDTKNPSVKYIADFYTYEDWMKQAKSDGQMDILNEIEPDKDKIYSWIRRYDPDTKAKTHVEGYCEMDLESSDMNVLILDDESGVGDTWKVTAKPCKQAIGNKKSPQLLATNSDLGAW